MPSRRVFLGSTAAGLVTSVAAGPRVRAAVLAAARDRRAAPRAAVLKPPRLSPGDTVGLINPCSIPLDPGDVAAVRDRVQALGLRLKEAPGIGPGHESAEDRAADVGAMFADDEVRA